MKRKARRVTQADYRAAGRALVRDIAADPRSKPKYRIRHCDGNREAWMIVALRPDGTEIDSFGGWTTSYSVDTLLRGFGLTNSGHLSPKPGELIELIA